MQTSPPSTTTAVAAVHPRSVIAAHWLTLLALLGAFALILTREAFDAKAVRAVLMDAHRMAGLLVGLFAVTRLVLRTRLPLAQGTHEGPAWQGWLASGLHGLLYLLLLALPLLGWALTSARGQSVSLLGGVHLPALLSADLDLADTLELWHGTLAWALAGLIGLHAGAAVWHHLVLRDGVLVAMLPRLKRRS
jgi:cytochrome b561